MDYKQSALWKAAFESSRTDATDQEQLRLAACYDAMRERASALVSKIAADLPHLTIHNVTHLDALWDMASIACGAGVDLNPAEAFLFGGAVLLHDAAMTLAAFPGGLNELRQQTEWRDLHARYVAGVQSTDVLALKDAEHRATAESLRLLHAKQAEKLAMVSWEGPHKQSMFLIENQQVRNFYGPKIGRIAYSHWWPLAKVEEELAGTLGALPGVTDCTIDLLKVACLLRVADAMHLDQRRAPAFEFALAQPTGVSNAHWQFQQRMAKPFVQGDALVFTAQPPFEVELAEAWWTAFDALQMVDRELRDVDRLLRDRQKKPLCVRRVDGAHSPSELARTVETVGWTPVDTTIRVSDVSRIVTTLGGSKLYGNGPIAPVREMIQNGLDAITARRKLQSRPATWGELQIILTKRDDGIWLCFEDNGVGMSQTVLTGPLIDFGNSFWRSSLALLEFPGLSSAGMKARGKYGIGFFSVFMLGSHVRVITRRFERDVQSARVLEFRNGLGSRPNLREADPKQVPIDGGTRIEVKLSLNPHEPGGILHRKGTFKDEIVKLADMIASIAPSCDVAIRVFEQDDLVGATEAGDWLKIGSPALLSRIGVEEKSASEKDGWQNLCELRDDAGRIYGRARLKLGYHWQPHGLITVDGLAASRIASVAGVFVGQEQTASRNAAEPIVPAPVLAAWASEQALLFVDAPVTDIDKASAGAIVMAMGGDVAALPVVLWRKQWMTSAQFMAAIEPLDGFVLHEGWFSYEDDDNVSKREFEAAFIPDSDIAQVPNNSGLGDWIRSIPGINSISPEDYIESLVSEAWVFYETELETMTVGIAYNDEIYRSVTVFRRIIEDGSVDD